MKIKLWGVRGSYPTPLKNDEIENKIYRALSLARPGDISSEEAVRKYMSRLPFSVTNTYGGNTACFEVRTSSGEIIIIDCGSGIAKLGRELMKEDFGQGKGMANIFITHTHWDHIHGLPFFTPIYVPGNAFNFYSPMSDLEERLIYQHKESHFPVPFDYLGATKRFFTVGIDEYFHINDVKIYTKLMPHPGGAYAIRIEDGNSSFVFSSDCEFNYEEIDTIGSYEKLFRDADILVFDAQYTFDESVIEKFSWGHSSASIAIDIASSFNVKKLLLFHHDPEYNDDKLDSIIYNAKSYVKMNKHVNEDMVIDIAKEGVEFVLD